jgi:hypothetical protein
MSARRSLVLGNEQGATVVIVAICLVALTSVVALAIDVGMLLTARAEAQRVADASAHAGAAEFWLVHDPPAATRNALDQAIAFAAGNTIRNAPVQTGATGGESWQGSVLRYDFEDGFIEVMPGEMKVRTTLLRRDVPTWFARVFGVNEVDVGARSAAAIRFAGSAVCVKPFAVPDAWDDRNNDGFVGNQPANDPATGEYYKRFEVVASNPPATGYGSAFRNPEDPVVQNDLGRRMRLRAGNQSTTPGPSMYFSWELPDDPNMPKGCPGGTGGQSTFQLNICSCNMNRIVLGQQYETLTGAAMGWVRNGLTDLIKQDPNARWDPVLKQVTGTDPKYGHWSNSPRVITVVLFDPRILLTEDNFKSGKQPIVFNNFASLFIEEPPPGSGQNDDIFGVLIPIARGMAAAGPGEVEGSLVRMLQIVE